MKTYLPILVFVCLFLSCSEHIVEIGETIPEIDEAPSFSELDADSDSSILVNFSGQQLDLEQAKLVLIDYPDGSLEEAYELEGDIILSKDQFADMARRQNRRQAVNYFWVKGISTINVYCGTGNPKISNGVDRAITNYNNVSGVGIKFKRVTNPFLAMIHVFESIYSNPFGASSGYPNPSYGDLLVGKIRSYRYIRVGLMVKTLTNDQIEHILTHEIGHCIGLWHTDWSSGFSCGTFTPDASPYWQIWGTPHIDNQSIMNKCWQIETNGEFSSFDALALKILF